ncbi:MAG: transporter substrate-binding domain-containing protein [Pseudomonadota bacterium]
MLAPASACELRHVYEDWPPYLYRDKTDAVTGLDAELMAAIARQANCKLVTLPNVPSLRRDLLFREGKVDLIPAASDIAERHAFARFSIAYRNETIRLFTTPAKLAGYRGTLGFGPIVQGKLALLAPATGWYGPAYAQVLDDLRGKGQLRTFGNIEQGVRMFGAGRADLILGDGPGISYVAAKLAVKLQPLPYVVHSAPVHLMLSKASTSEADVRRINAAIIELEKRGTLAAIRARYE